jgi:hypothetical protein
MEAEGSQTLPASEISAPMQATQPLDEKTA